MFTALPADTIDVTNGPNARGCENGDMVDPDLYDSKFSCKCSRGFMGDNCEESSVQWELIGPLIAVIAIVLLLLIVWRVQMYRFKRRPLDVNAILLQLLAELGLGATAVMKDNEIGVTVTVVPLDDHNSELEGKALDKFKNTLLKMAADKLKMSASNAWVQPGPSPLRAVVVVFSKAPGHTDEAFSQKVADFDRELQLCLMSVGETRMTSIMIALPSRTPREIVRNALVRINTIASGNFGEVFRGELAEGQMGRSVKFIVAVKVCKGKASETAKDNLLKEAALMVSVEST
jgi:hypothetical protein